MMELSRREKAFVGGGVAILVVFFLFAGVLSPMVKHRSNLDKSIRSMTSQLEEVYALSSKIKAVAEATPATSAATRDDFTVFGFLEQLASELGIKVENMKPIGDAADSSRESVEVRIRGIHVPDLIRLLYGIENSPHSLTIRRLNVRRMEREKNINITFQVVSYG